MVDVSAKDSTERMAMAEATIVLSEEAYSLVISGAAKKGDVLATARIAGIMAAKKTSELIPLCHPLALSHVGVDFDPLPERNAFRIVASAKTSFVSDFITQAPYAVGEFMQHGEADVKGLQRLSLAAQLREVREVQPQRLDFNPRISRKVYDDFPPAYICERDVG